MESPSHLCLAIVTTKMNDYEPAKNVVSCSSFICFRSLAFQRGVKGREDRLVLLEEQITAAFLDNES